MAKLTKKQTLGRGLSALLKETTIDVSEQIRLKEKVKEYEEKIEKIETERDRLLTLVENLTDALIKK
jgi:hypothetical protein